MGKYGETQWMGEGPATKLTVTKAKIARELDNAYHFNFKLTFMYNKTY